MKTTITILSICLFIFAGTQSAQAQTQEETIAWIKEKLEKYGGDEYFDSYFKDVQVSPCKISYVERLSSESYSMSFNPSTVKEWKVDSDKRAIFADTKAIRSVSNSDGDVNMLSHISLKNGESDIHERMIKALLYLATFCDEGKNETF
ncbi:MAG: hypothetical protein WCY25_01995 [Moheibacter sp.]